MPVDNILEDNGRSYTAHSTETVQNIFTSHYHMPVKYWQEHEEPIDCGIYVKTFVGQTYHPILCITLRNARTMEVPFSNLREISKWKQNSIVIYYYSSEDGQTKTHHLHSQATRISNVKIRPKKENISAILNWLHIFRG